MHVEKSDEEVFQGEAAAEAAGGSDGGRDQAAVQGARPARPMPGPAAGSRRADGESQRRRSDAEAAARALRRRVDRAVGHHGAHERHRDPDAGRRQRRRRRAVVPDPGPARVRRDAPGRRQPTHGVRAAVGRGGAARERARGAVCVRDETTRHPDGRLLGGHLQVGPGRDGSAHRLHDGAQEPGRLGDVGQRPTSVHHHQHGKSPSSRSSIGLVLAVLKLLITLTHRHNINSSSSSSSSNNNNKGIGRHRCCTLVSD